MTDDSTRRVSIGGKDIVTFTNILFSFPVPPFSLSEASAGASRDWAFIDSFFISLRLKLSLKRPGSTQRHSRSHLVIGSPRFLSRPLFFFFFFPFFVPPRSAGKYTNAKCAHTVHNIAFQGRFWPTSMSELGLPDSAAGDFFFEDSQQKLFDERTPQKEGGEKLMPTGKKYRKDNWMKAAFINSDRNITVSMNYAKEISGSASKGVELNTVINATGGIEGIVNGMDPTEWNPATDKFLDITYDKNTVVMGKAAAKQALQAEVGLPLDPSAPIFGYIGRLEEQKGCDIMMAAVPKLLRQVPNAQVVILGTGKKSMEKDLEKLDGMSKNMAGVVKFSNPIAHYITAGADFLMVPSRFEPCGLIQLHAMQYGTVPIVASTGGLVDTVKEGVTGFHMGAMDPDALVSDDVEAMVDTCAAAAAVYGTPTYTKMSATCIGQDLSWKKPAAKWEAILEEMMFNSGFGKKQQVITPKEELVNSPQVASSAPAGRR